MQPRAPRLTIRFEMLALRQWAKIAVPTTATFNALRALLASKFDSDFEHMPLRAFLVVTQQGRLSRQPLPANQPLREIEALRDCGGEVRVVLELDYWGG